MLPRPLGGHVGEAGHSHTMRQPSRDGRVHEIGRQEGKRDRHVDLPNAAPLALGDAFRICVRVGKKFVEPAAASRNRRHQERAGLQSRANASPFWIILLLSWGGSEHGMIKQLKASAVEIVVDLGLSLAP